MHSIIYLVGLVVVVLFILTSAGAHPSPELGGALVLLHKVYGTWRVTEVGSAFVGCDGKAPKAVRIDLELTCPGGK